MNCVRFVRLQEQYTSADNSPGNVLRRPSTNFFRILSCRWISFARCKSRHFATYGLPRDHPAVATASLDYKLLGFKRQLRSPDHVLINADDAKRQYGLTDSDLSTLEAYNKENPFDTAGSTIRQYMLPEVIRLALFRHKSSAKVLHRYSRFLENEARKELHTSKIYGFQSQNTSTNVMRASWKWQRPPFLPNKADISGYHSLMRAFYSNMGITSVKLFVFMNTGSSAVFADLAHSVADVVNYGYRLMTVRWSAQRPADSIHPYGYSRLRYICADRSFGTLFLVGGAIPLLHAMTESAVVYSQFPALPLGMFAVSASLELVAARAGYKEVELLAKRSGISFREYLRTGSDIIPIATFMEASTGVVGSLLGSVGLILAFYTGTGLWDLAASYIMASSVIYVSGSLLVKSQTALVGRTLPLSTVTRILGLLESNSVVVAVHDVKTEVSGMETVRFKAEIEFNAEEITKRRLGLRIPSIYSDTLNEFQSLRDATNVEDWIMRNDSKFLYALTSELKQLESIIRTDLREHHTFLNIHIDLEPW